MSEETRSDPPPDRPFPYAENEVPLDPPELDLDSPSRHEARARRRSRRKIPPARASAAPTASRDDEDDRPRLVDSMFMRVLGLAGVVGIATAVGGIMGAQDVSGWEIGLVVSITTTVLLGILFTLRAG